MQKFFDGKKIRDQILGELKTKIEKIDQKPGLAVFCIGDNPVCSKYVSLKKKFADRIGIEFYDFAFDANNTQEEIVAKIEELNTDQRISGIMIQMPIPEKFDKFEVVHSISPEKDVDGLRFCCSYKSGFKPPVVLAILEAIKQSFVCESPQTVISTPQHCLRAEKSSIRGSLDYARDDKGGARDDKGGAQGDISIEDCLKNKEIVIVGRGFLVGWPLAQCLEEAVLGVIVADENTTNLSEITKNADVIISAVGKHSIIQPEMIKEGVVLIDAGTTEVSGELLGDIDPACYEKASFYTPVPGGIGPVTVAKLFENLIGS